MRNAGIYVGEAAKPAVISASPLGGSFHHDLHFCANLPPNYPHESTPEETTAYSTALGPVLLDVTSTDAVVGTATATLLPAPRITTPDAPPKLVHRISPPISARDPSAGLHSSYFSSGRNREEGSVWGGAFRSIRSERGARAQRQEGALAKETCRRERMWRRRSCNTFTASLPTTGPW